MLHDAEVHHALAVGTNAHVHASWRCFVFSCMEFVHGRLATCALNKFKRAILPRVRNVCLLDKFPSDNLNSGL
jgi:hypothetical protein